MAHPVILAVDDEPLVLDAVVRDLRSQFGDSHRIVGAGGGSDALEALHDLKIRNAAVALFVVDQRMPGMNGVAFLAAAGEIYPEARSILLTAHADTEVAIAAINTVGLDRYLMKPWDPPDQGLYPAITELLNDWAMSADVPYDGIRVAGTLWSSASHDVKDFLARNRIPYRWTDLERDRETSALLESIFPEGPGLPVVLFPDGTALESPTLRDLADRIGIRTEAATDIYDLVIIGGGPAGLAAAVNASAEGFSTVLIEREATGGQAGTSSRIENYLGFPSGISGAELAERATTQARRLGAEILLTREARSIRVDDPYRYVVLDDGTELAARAIIVATGMAVSELKTPGVARLTGAGIYYGAALTEAVHYRDRPVAIVGGANSAGQAAMWFARYASKVHLIVRAGSINRSMSSYLVDQIGREEAIAVRLRSEVVEAHGDTALRAITVEDKDGGDSERLRVAAMAIFVGTRPRTEFLEGIVERTGAGFIPTGFDIRREGDRPRGWPLRRQPMILETSVPGIFAAGDVRLGAQSRVGAAVGSGSVAVGLIREYLRTV